APKARRDFIAAVTRRAGLFGLSAERIAEAREEGELLVIDGQPHPRGIARQRARLAERIRAQGFEPVMEATAYTWFNRLVAIRYMELHGFLDHSYRVLSHPAAAGGTGAPPEILEQAQHVELPGLERERVIALKMDGTQDETLYRELLLAQCRALHQAMPFLFEPVDDETELLLPDRLLQTDSLIRELVSAIPEADWQPIEIIGWLYQFYISEKKDQVIGKVVKSEDIPAATQLFTPNWIVKYMVQNSLGAQWLATYPDSPLKARMAYYIEPAEQTPEVQAQLDALKRVDSGQWIVNSEEERGEKSSEIPSGSSLSTIHYSLNPEELTLMDPACGSGHILVEAYELFKAIYLERGYRLRDIPKLILEKNLYGLDIDPRAAQLAGFALMMKAREDDRRVLERGIALNVMAFEEVDSGEWIVDREEETAGSAGLLSTIHSSLPTEQKDAVDELVELFRHARTFGSLIQVPEELAAKLPALRRLCEQETGDLFVADGLRQLRALVRQAELLARKYDAVVANPPYMGKGMNPLVKKMVNDHFSVAKSDLYACFTERSYNLARSAGHIAMVTMQSWMFLSSFRLFRERMLREKTIMTMVQIGYNSFPSMNSKVAQATAFALLNKRAGNYTGTFFDLNSAAQSSDKNSVFLARNPSSCFLVSVDKFKKIPDSPVAYWVSENIADAFKRKSPLGQLLDIKAGMSTTDNELFLRLWNEISVGDFDTGASSREEARQTNKRWFPYIKGGPFRRWYGNSDYVVNWQNDGHDIRRYIAERPEKQVGGRLVNLEFFFRECLSWTRVSSGDFSCRFHSKGSIFSDASNGGFGDLEQIEAALMLLNSKIVASVLAAISPTLNFYAGDIAKIPAKLKAAKLEWLNDLVDLSRYDWNAYERSWDFQYLPILNASNDPQGTLESSYTTWINNNRQTIAEMKRLEEENNRLFIDAYGLQDELTPEVPIDQITLTVNPAYRYGKKLSDDDWSVEHGFPEELETRFREDSMQELVSYAIGCAMGRYRLDRPGLIYAHSGNERFWEIWRGEVDSGKWIVNSEEGEDLSTNNYPLSTKNFRPDEDGILPITDTDWFEDDAANRVVEFIATAFGEVDSEKSIVDSEEDEQLSTNHYPLSTKNLEENLSFLATNLGPKKTETPRETIRRYLADKFFKDHLQTYKKRPIYWCFSSGKQKAFQCLVYLHRYHEGTLARMRMEYV
ncbi:MAG: BREX-1 system adenine-specific DNA-methyltransferase PglX, partial [Lamprobacter sp.]|uniref:BREX-1 system adenine-specific DNA-methyltransferase PglX n=1 Tax=Lamprobacter sp. TaxID=3100796 RepID=UPI002B25F5D0